MENSLITAFLVGLRQISLIRDFIALECEMDEEKIKTATLQKKNKKA